MPPTVPQPYRGLPLSRECLIGGARLTLLWAMLTAAGCIILPVPSVTPDRQSGIIEDDTLESLIGLDQEGVSERIGWPDYSGNRGDFYVMVYQGEKEYSTEVYAVISGGYSAGAAKIDDGISTTLYCYIIELDDNRQVAGYDVDTRPTTGVTVREGTASAIEPADDCSEVVWGAGGQYHD